MAITVEQKALAQHRLTRAKTTLDEAIDELSRNNYRLAVNRAYYSIFYMMRAFLATVSKDSSKHSGVMALFNQYFIKTGIISDISFKEIQSLMDLRHEGDYQDFVEITVDEANGAVEIAKRIFEVLKDNLNNVVSGISS